MERMAAEDDVNKEVQVCREWSGERGRGERGRERYNFVESERGRGGVIKTEGEERGRGVGGGGGREEEEGRRER